jgi:hypothetical protein
MSCTNSNANAFVSLVFPMASSNHQGVVAFRKKMQDLQRTLVARAYSLLRNNWEMIVFMTILRLTGLFDGEREGIDDIFWCIYTLAVEKPDVNQ